MGKTPLFYAKSPKMAEFLLQSGANPNAKDMWGHNALLYIEDQATKDLVKKYSENISPDLGKVVIKL